MKRLLIIPFLLLSILVSAQEQDASRAEKIKADDAYVTGDGFGATMEEASGRRPQR